MEKLRGLSQPQLQQSSKATTYSSEHGFGKGSLSNMRPWTSVVAISSAAPHQTTAVLTVSMPLASIGVSDSRPA